MNRDDPDRDSRTGGPDEQQTDIDTGHGVRGQGGQSESKGVPDAGDTTSEEASDEADTG